MNTRILRADERGLMQNPVFKGYTLFSNGNNNSEVIFHSSSELKYRVGS